MRTVSRGRRVNVTKKFVRTIIKSARDPLTGNVPVMDVVALMNQPLENHITEHSVNAAQTHSHAEIPSTLQYV